MCRQNHIIPLVVTGVFLGLTLLTISETFLYKQAHDQDKEYKLVEPELEEEDEIVFYHKKNNSQFQESLLDLKNFTWLLNNKSICQVQNNDLGELNKARLMPILIHSARSHFSQRLAIRKTWGSLSNFMGWTIRLIFLLGEEDPLKYNKSWKLRYEMKLDKERILEEQRQFGDLVMGNFIDSYHNLTYKHLMGYRWILAFCPEAEIVTKVDDDIFLDIMQWLRLFTVRLDPNLNPSFQYPVVNQEPKLFCKVWPHSIISRNNVTKWSVSYEYMPGTHYPPFCSGRAYAIKTDLLKKIYEVAHEIRFNWVDDVFVTGQVVHHLEGKFNERVNFGDITEVCTNLLRGRNITYCTGRNKNERKFQVVTVLPHSPYFNEDMKCMWEMALVDYYFSLTRIRVNPFHL